MTPQSSLRVSLIQICSNDHLLQNLKTCRELIVQAKQAGAEFVLLPENFSFLGHEDEKLKNAALIQQESESFLTNLSRELGVWILGGGYAAISPDEQKVYNQSMLVNPQGESVAMYQKIHLFDADLPQGKWHESKRVKSGNNVTVAKLKDWVVGLSICYDVRFPELYRQLTNQGAQILTVPAAFTVPTGQAHWHTLLRARAIENQCYVLAPAQTGEHSKTRASFGHSLIVDPWGEIVCDAGIAEGFVIADLGYERLQTVRQNMPVLVHKKL